MGGEIRILTKRVVFFVLVILFALSGFYGASLIMQTGLIKISGWTQLGFGIEALGVLIGLVAGFLLAPLITRGVSVFTSFLEQILQKTPLQDLLLGAIALIIALIITNLLRPILLMAGIIGNIAWVFLTVLLGYLSINFTVKKREEILGLFSSLRFKEKTLKGEKKQTNIKILDTSVIIDGRIADLCESGFVEGTLLVPAFILEELRHIADSEDALKRNRGRRGLDILNMMQKSAKIKVQVYENERGLDNAAEVDTKLVKVAQKLGAKIFTNDYNLNKVAELHGVGVLNINELPNATHLALAQLEKLGYLRATITQNVDGLHQMAGNTNVIEFHGNNHYVVCLNCSQRYRGEDISTRTLPPRCSCGGILKPDIVLFGESIPSEALSRSKKEVQQAGVLLVIGTSAAVAPAAHIPYFASRTGATVVEINPVRALHMSIALEGKAEEIMPLLVEKVIGLSS